jgi:hypothetical protein
MMKALNLNLIDYGASGSILCTFVEICAFSISNVLKTGKGPVSVKCILDTRFLPSLLKSTAKLSYMSADVRDNFTHAICEYIGHHLTFHSILVSVEKPVNKIDQSGMDAAAMGQIWDAWSIHKNAIQGHLTQKKYFDEDEKLCVGPGYGCKRPEVSLQETNLWI